MTQTIERTGKNSQALTATRVLAGITAGLILLQGASAGSHLTGVGGALDLHRRVGTEFLSILVLAIVLTAAFGARRLTWPLPVAIVGFLGTGMQIGMGFSHQLGVHLPLGVTLFGIYLAMALLIKNKSEETS